MDDSWVSVLEHHWPWAIPILVLCIALGYVAKLIPAIQSGAGRVAAWIKRASRREQEKIDARVADLEGQVQYLTEVVEELRARDRLNWAWILSDQEWHRKVELDAAAKGWDIPRHTSYEEFSDGWAKRHPMPKPYQP